MGFRAREKKRQLAVALDLFSREALATPGPYGRKKYPFCLAENRSEENLWSGIRREVLAYFDGRSIDWHGGFKRRDADGVERRFPSGHLCDSQVFCVNVWWPFVTAPERLAAVLRGLGFSVAEMMPMSTDGSEAFVAFEWIGHRNYLGEGRGGRPTPDGQRTRGKNATSADAAVRFKRTDGRIQMLLIEWKYTEAYGRKSLRVSRRGTDRSKTYVPHIRHPESPFAGFVGREDDLFYDPFDQLMRLQLLAAAMERENELDASVVSVLHLAPSTNRELVNTVTSPNLAALGANIHDVWRRVVGDARFSSAYVDRDLLPLVVREMPERVCAEWLQRRFGGLA